MKRAAIYTRVSTDEQARHGLSLDAQIESLRAFAKANGYQIIGEFQDAGISARKPYKKRPALLQMLQLVEAEQVDVILFIKLDRWFRNVMAYYQVQPILDAHNVAWRATMEDYETETSAGRFKVNIMLSVAEAEADRTAERIRFVFDGKRQRGEVITGSVPLGFKSVNNHLQVESSESAVVADLFNHFLSLRSRNAVCRYALQQYQRRLTPRGLLMILSRHIYVEYGIITQQDYDQAQQLLKERARRTPKASSDCYLFSGLMYCSCCGHRMRGTHDKGRHFYTCSNHSSYGFSVCQHNKIMREDRLEQYMLSHVVAAAEEYNISIRAKKKSPAASVDTAGIKRKMNKLKDLYLSDLIDKDTYKADYEQLKGQLEAAEASKTPVEREIDVEAIKNISEVYNSLTKENRRSLWAKFIRRIDVDEQNNISVKFF